MSRRHPSKRSRRNPQRPATKRRREMQAAASARKHVMRRMGDARVRFTLCLHNAADALVRGVEPDSPAFKEHREILEVFCETLGDDWARHALKPLPPNRPWDCPEERPCHAVLCKWNLAVEVTSRGSLRLTHPRVPLSEQETCMYDVIRQNVEGLTLAAVGRRLELRRVRTHQIWRSIQKKLSAALGPAWAELVFARRGAE